MTTDELVLAGVRPLRVMARPAGRPRTPDRFLFAVTTVDQVPTIARRLASTLEAMVGPTRATRVTVQTARGPAVDRALVELVERRGQSRETADRLAASYLERAAAAKLEGLVAVLLIAQVGVLWPQSLSVVGLQ